MRTSASRTPFYENWDHRQAYAEFVSNPATTLNGGSHAKPAAKPIEPRKPSGRFRWTDRREQVAHSFLTGSLWSTTGRFAGRPIEEAPALSETDKVRIGGIVDVLDRYLYTDFQTKGAAWHQLPPPPPARPGGAGDAFLPQNPMTPWQPAPPQQLMIAPPPQQLMIGPPPPPPQSPLQQPMIAPPPQQLMIAPPPQQPMIAPQPQQLMIGPPPQQPMIAPPPQQLMIGPPPQQPMIAPPTQQLMIGPPPSLSSSLSSSAMALVPSVASSLASGASSGVASGLSYGASSAVSGLQSAVTNAVSSAPEAASGLFGRIGSLFSSGTGLVGRALGAVKGAVTGVVSGALDKGYGLLQSGVGLVKGLYDTLSSSIAYLWGSFGPLIKSVTAFLATTPGWAFLAVPIAAAGLYMLWRKYAQAPEAASDRKAGKLLEKLQILQGSLNGIRGAIAAPQFQHLAELQQAAYGAFRQYDDKIAQLESILRTTPPDQEPTHAADMLAELLTIQSNLEATRQKLVALVSPQSAALAQANAPAPTFGSQFGAPSNAQPFNGPPPFAQQQQQQPDGFGLGVQLGAPYGYPGVGFGFQMGLPPFNAYANQQPPFFQQQPPPQLGWQPQPPWQAPPPPPPPAQFGYQPQQPQWQPQWQSPAEMRPPLGFPGSVGA